MEALNNLGLSLDQMRAQGYDGTSVMSGRVNGIQVRIQRQNPKADVHILILLSGPRAEPMHCSPLETTTHQKYYAYHARGGA